LFVLRQPTSANAVNPEILAIERAKLARDPPRV